MLTMESEFRTLVAGNSNFNDVTLERFSALPEAHVGIYFDTSTIVGTNFMSEVMLLRKRFNQSQGKVNHLSCPTIWMISGCDFIVMRFSFCFFRSWRFFCPKEAKRY